MAGISFITVVILLFPIFVTCRHLRTNEDSVNQCGYSSCPATKEGFINVHLIPHTHDDVGWLKTVDQYYFGSRTSIQKAGVQYILDSVVQALKRDPSRRFIYVETAFFWKWWERQSAAMRRDVQDLVASGQLEFISGGWSMHDEATTHYHSIVDQFTWGFRKLNDTFGHCGVPRVGWQIDPFGHSRETASLMARLGFDGLFLGRIDYQDKVQRMLNRTMEVVWQASSSLGKEADLFTGVLFNTYSAPTGFCFDILCQDEPIIDDKSSPDFNADRRATEFLADVAKRSMVYKGFNIAVALGDDFNYQAAHLYFNNVDLLIKAVNARQTSHNSNINLLYSTPSCYLKALNDEGIHFPVKDDDFFPYASDPHAYWTGYFTSRPTLKYFERLGNNLLQVCKQTAVLSNLHREATTGLDSLREAMGVMQHHDAVSGTEKQHVANDYARRLTEGLDQCANITENALNKLIRKGHSSPPVTMTSCLLLNISQCDITETEASYVITLYNPLSRPVSRYIRLPVSGANPVPEVFDSQGQVLPVQAVPIPDLVIKIPGRFSEATVEVVFKASDIPPLGYRSYYVTRGNTLLAPDLPSEPVHGRLFTIGKGSMKLEINGSSGLPTTLLAPGMDEPVSFENNFYYFLSAAGDNKMNNRSSGAYILRPNSSYVMVNPQPVIKFYKGPLVSELHQTFSNWVSQIIRVYAGEDHIEFNWMVGPIPISDNIGKEVVTRYQVYGMGTNGTFYTDSNGREMLRRELNSRPAYHVTLEEPVAGNYYPVNTRITMKDEDLRLSVITDRSEGGTSLKDGQIELMLHRRILHDDGFGVEEALNEEAFGHGLVARGTHYLPSGSSSAERKLVQARILAVQAYFTPTSLSLKEWQNFYNMEWSGLQSALPDSVQILTLEPWKESSFLLRLEHILEVDDGGQPVTVNLQTIGKITRLAEIRAKTAPGDPSVSESQSVVDRESGQTMDTPVKHQPTSTSPSEQPADTFCSKIQTIFTRGNGAGKRKKPNRKQIKRSYQYGCCFYILLVIFVLSTLGSIVMWFTDIYLDSILNQMTLKNDTEIFKAWEKPPVKPLICVYIFNYTNMEEYMAEYSTKIQVNETGPYCYRETLVKTNIKFDDNGTVSYSDRRTHEFEEKNSTGRTDDVVIVPNLPIIGAVAKISELPGIAQLVLRMPLEKNFKRNTMIKVKTHDFLFGYNDTLMSFAKGVSKFIHKDLPFEKFGMLAMRAAETNDTITVRTGAGDLNSIGVVTAVNGEDHLDAWDSEECNRLDGSDGAFFPRHEINQSATLHLFHKDLCRKLPLVYQKEVDFQDGVMGMRFHTPPDVYNTTGTCYCKDGKCPPVGVFDISPCAMGIPIMMSFPHFMNAEPSVTNHLEGLNPDPLKHDFFIDIQPILGFTLGTVSRIQINVQIRKSPYISMLDEFADGTILPVVWLEVTADRLPPDLFAMIYHASVTVQMIQWSLQWGLLAIWICSGVGLLFYLRRQSSIQVADTPSPVTNLPTTKEILQVRLTSL